MKLLFEPVLDFQHEAIEAVCGLFRDQEASRIGFTVTRDTAGPVFRDSVAASGTCEAGRHGDGSRVSGAFRAASEDQQWQFEFLQHG